MSGQKSRQSRKQNRGSRTSNTSAADQSGSRLPKLSDSHARKEPRDERSTKERIQTPYAHDENNNPQRVQQSGVQGRRDRSGSALSPHPRTPRLRQKMGRTSPRRRYPDRRTHRSRQGSRRKARRPQILEHRFSVPTL